MIVVSDTSAISNLLLIGEIDILRITFSRIAIPDSVFERYLEGVSSYEGWPAEKIIARRKEFHAAKHKRHLKVL